MYDGLGRVIRTEYADGTNTSVEYDSSGRTVAQTDQLGNTTRYEYDDFGRLTAVVLAAVPQPGTGQMVHPRYEYEYDAAGNRTVLRDGVFQTDPLDPDTIDRSGARETRLHLRPAGPSDEQHAARGRGAAGRDRR